MTLDRAFNGDQTGLFYSKLPNRTRLDKKAAKEKHGCKQMKDKSRVALMICAAASGEKAPLAMVGKSLKPHCFRSL